VRMGAVHIGEIARCTNPNTGAVQEGRLVSQQPPLLQAADEQHWQSQCLPCR
jgi:hypothetical protein